MGYFRKERMEILQKGRAYGRKNPDEIGNMHKLDLEFCRHGFNRAKRIIAQIESVPTEV